MNNPEVFYKNLIKLLDDNQVEYKHFHHQPALTYEQLLEVQKQTGFFGTEGKCLVLKADDIFLVYVTIQGKKINFDEVKKETNSNKISLVTPEDLKEVFGAEPGCAYPFGFDTNIPIYIDPIIFDQEWFLFSPVFPNQTIQARGSDLKKVFSKLGNIVVETTKFNQ
jgi:hypothetical protein